MTDHGTRPYQMCSVTVMDTTDNDIEFDHDGVCSHVLDFRKWKQSIVEQANDGSRLEQLDQLFRTIRKSGEGKPYDCVIGISGGVDSTYLTLLAVQHGLRPLVVHFDSGWNSELAVSNINNLVTSLHLDLYTDVVDWREMRDLQLSFFKASVANCDIPTDHAFAKVAFTQAQKYGIKYILSGGNLASESILPASWGYTAHDARHVKGIQKQFGTVRLKTYPLLGMFKRYGWYQTLHGIKTVRPLDYLPYRYDQAKSVITHEVGWRDYGGKHHESVFTRYFQGYYLPHKFGFDKRKAHYSSLILSGQMTREEALGGLEEPPYDESLREQDHLFIAKKLGISVDEFEEIINLPPVDHLEYPNEKKFWDYLRKLLSPIRTPQDKAA